MKKIFFLTNLEEKVFLSLNEDLCSVTSIANNVSLPRTSVFKALQKLEELDLVVSKKVRFKNQSMYCRISDEEITKKFDDIKKKIVRSKKEFEVLSISASINAAVYSGKKQVFERLVAMMSQEKGGRIYMLQASGSTKDWISFLGEEYVLRIHDLFKEKGLIVVVIQGESYADYLKKYSNTVINSLKERLDDIHIIPDDFLEKKTALYIYKSVVLFVDIEKLHAVEIHNQLLSRVLKKMILYMSDKSPRVRGIYDIDNE